MVVILLFLVLEKEEPIEVINNVKYGFSFENGSAEDCARQIINIVNMKDLDLEIIKEKAFKRVLNNFDIGNTATGYLNNY